MGGKPCIGLLDDSCDESLVSHVVLGDRQAFDELVVRHRSACLAVALSIVRNQADAEDVVQIALWKAYRRIGQFERRARFKHWLLRIVSNECLMRLRGNRRRNTQSLQELPAGAAVTRLNPERDFLKAELEQKVLREVRRLPLLLRDPVFLHEMHEISLPEVARQLGTTVAAAKSRLHRGRRELKARVTSVAA